MLERKEEPHSITSHLSKASSRVGLDELSTFELFRPSSAKWSVVVGKQGKKSHLRIAIMLAGPSKHLGQDSPPLDQTLWS